MTYAIKLDNGNGAYLKSFNEFIGGVAAPLSFDTIADAEEYAQNYEIKNYAIAAIVDSDWGRTEAEAAKDRKTL